MWRLLLVFAVFQIVNASCPDGYDIVLNGECRGLQANMTLSFGQATTKAIDKCADVDALPVIIHNEEASLISCLPQIAHHRKFQQQTYWKELAPPTSVGFLILGLVCNVKTTKWEWVDGSALDYRPSGGYNEALDNECQQDWSWDIHPDGFWSYGNGGNPITALIYCTKQLEQITPSPDGCDNFEDDAEDGVCYQVGPAAQNWQDAQMACKKFGADLASIHNAQENTFVRRLAVSKGAVNGVFLGASAGKDGKFGWVDGSVMDYENYYPGFPKKNFGDCVAMDTSTSSGQWMNVDCATKLPVACIRNQKAVSEPRCSDEDWTENTVITSPGFPNSSSTPCDYFLTAESGKKVELEILLLEANSCCDSLILYDGYLGGSVIAKLSGNIHNTTYTTKTSNIMRVSWQPNGGVNVRGLAMTYRAV